MTPTHLAPFNFGINKAALDRRDLFAAVAARNATVEVPAEIIARAEENDVLGRPVGNPDGKVFGIAGKVLTAARELRETTACLIVARNRLDGRGGVSYEALARITKDLDEVEAMMSVLRDQVNAAQDDRFDAEEGIVREWEASL